LSHITKEVLAQEGGRVRDQALLSDLFRSGNFRTREGEPCVPCMPLWIDRGCPSGAKDGLKDGRPSSAPAPPPAPAPGETPGKPEPS